MANLASVLAVDPTLLAIDSIMEEIAAQEKPRPYLGMSQIGEACERKSWYRYRFAKQEKFNAETLKKFADGYRSEALIIERLKLHPDLVVKDIDEATGKQFGFVDHDGHFRGHADGTIIGILQAPKTPHILEIKCCSDKKIAELKKAVADCGEKGALKKWNPIYHAQGVLYCDYMGYDRHYLVASTPGGRDWMGVRTYADPALAIKLRARAKRTIMSHEPLTRISNDPSWYECRWCPFTDICHKDDVPDRTCRSCAHSEVRANSEWGCARWGKKLTLDEQLIGCPSHAYLPALVPGEIVDSTDVTVTYKLKDGSTWTDGEIV